jgi:rare lipoprotein A
MTRRQVLRESRLAHVAVGAVALAVPASAAAALAGKDSGAPPSGGASVAGAHARKGPETTHHKLRLRRHSFNVLSGQSIAVRGRVFPALPWRRVRLEGRSSGRWVTLANSQTGRRGGFTVRYAPQGLASEPLRVVVGGGSGSAKAWAAAGSLTSYRESVASWYDDGGGTACGFHAHYGVANRTLPCGSRITFIRGGHRVTAVVDDRGPFVSGRDWDLNQNTAGALAFDGVETVWSSG